MTMKEEPHALVCRSGGGDGGVMCLVVDMAILGCSESWFSSILASPFSGCSDLWASLLGGSELWVYGILASWVFGCPDSWVYCNPGSSDSSAHLDLRLSVWMFAAGRR